MQTLLIKLDDLLIKPVMDFLSSYPSDYYQIRNIDFDINDDFDIFQYKIANSQAMNELRNGETIKLDKYMELWGIK